MSSSSRRFVAGVFRFGLVILALFVVSRYFVHRVSRGTSIQVQTEAPPPSDSLGPGDLRIYNSDSSFDLVLVGDKVFAGLSPKMVAHVKASLDTSGSQDSSGLGASISQIVKKSVAGAIGTHAVSPLADIRDIRYESGRIAFEWQDGKKHSLFTKANVNGKNVSNSFRAEDAERFIEAVRAKKARP